MTSRPISRRKEVLQKWYDAAVVAFLNNPTSPKGEFLTFVQATSTASEVLIREKLIRLPVADKIRFMIDANQLQTGLSMARTAVTGEHRKIDFLVEWAVIQSRDYISINGHILPPTAYISVENNLLSHTDDDIGRNYRYVVKRMTRALGEIAINDGVSRIRQNPSRQIEQNIRLLRRGRGLMRAAK